MEFLNRLQFIHCDTLFATREDAIKYVEDIHNIQRPALYAEPMILKYGQEENPSIILAIGSVGNGVADMTNKTFFIDLAFVNGKLVELEDVIMVNKEDIENIKNILTAIKTSCGFNEDGSYIKSENQILKGVTNLSEANEILAIYIQALENKLQLNVESTNSIHMTLDKGSEGMVLSSNVVLAPNIITDNKLVQPNIIISTANGLFANVELDYQSDNNALILGVNGVNKEIKLPEHISVESGQYVPDTEEMVLTMNNGNVVKIAMGELIREWTVQEESLTPVVLTLEQVTSEDLAHGNKKWQDILKADIRISDDTHAPFNILTKDEDGRSLRVDGLASKIQYQVGGEKYITIQEAIDNINFEYNAATNNLIFTYANKEVKNIALNSVKLLDEIRYDANSESIVIVYQDVNNQNQRISVPVGDLIAEWNIENANHTVSLVKTRNIQGVDILTADVNVTEKGVNNNILEVLNGKLYVNGVADNIKYENTNIKTAMDELVQKINTNEVNIAQNTGSIIAEKTERIAKDEIFEQTLVDLQNKVTKNADDIISESIRAKAVEDKLEATIGLNEDGSFIKNAVNYGAEATTIGAEISHIDAVLKNTADKVDGNINNIENLKNSIQEVSIALNDELGRAQNAENALGEQLSEEVSRAQNAENALSEQLSEEVSRAQNAENALGEQLSEEVSRAQNAENALSEQLSEEVASVQSEQTVIYEEIEKIHTLIGQSTDSSEADSVYGAIKKVDDTVNAVTERVDTLENMPFTTTDDVKNIVNSNKSVVTNSDHTIDVQQVDVEDKGVEYQVKVNVSSIEGNIISQTNTDGIYANVDLNYNPATNTIQFKTSNHSTKEIKLNAGTIISNAYYDAESKDLVIEYTIDNVEATQSVRIPVESFYTPLEVKEGNSTVVLTIENGKISAKAMVSTLSSNILEVDADSALYVNGDEFVKEGDFERVINEAKTEVEVADNDKNIIVTSKLGTNGQTVYTIGSKDIPSIENIQELESKIELTQELINNLNVTDNAVENQYIAAVNQVNGKIEILRKVLPSSDIIFDNVKGYTDAEIQKLNSSIEAPANHFLTSIVQESGKITSFESKEFEVSAEKVLFNNDSFTATTVEDALVEIKEYANKTGNIKNLISTDNSIIIGEIDSNGNIDLKINNNYSDFGTY